MVFAMSIPTATRVVATAWVSAATFAASLTEIARYLRFLVMGKGDLLFRRIVSGAEASFPSSTAE